MKTLFFHKKSISLLIVVVSCLLVIANVLLQDGQYYYISSMVIVMMSWLLMYVRYEQEKPSLRRIVILAVMIALVVSSRVVFILTPSFKPMSAMIMICGIVFGKEEGFLCGSIAAFVSNFIFGQGPWTPFQMISWGIIGYGAGYLNGNQTYMIYGYAIFSGIFFTLCMDLWSVLLYETFQWQRYFVQVAASMPTTIIYCIANVIFIFLLKDTCIQKFDRIKKKYRWEIVK
ncbi:MAG: ECF transporter S component [Coprobacillaceae bacterium]